MDLVKVLVVDDSALMRKILSDIINSQENMIIVSTARDGEEALKKVELYNPDIVTMDIEMPKLNGLEALKEIKKKNYNCNVIMVSSASRHIADITIECLNQGAFDFIEKPTGTNFTNLYKIETELIKKIKASLKVVKKKTVSINNQTIKHINKSCKVEAIVLGASTGGPRALHEVITNLPGNLDVPIFVVQHMPANFTKAFAERLNLNSKLKVVEAKQNDIIEKNCVYIAPGDYHMVIEDKKYISLNKEPNIWGVRPAVDKLFISASNVYKNKLVSVILTGMGRDGTEGSVFVKDAGGITISEDESTCTIYGMPKMAFNTGKIDIVLPINEISNYLTKLTE
ncbi:MAG: chemotaxis response regulator protein-glutamate methylesterase [Clostridiaceae bacterium]